VRLMDLHVTSRMAVARHSETPQELTLLATDPFCQVRLAVAKNFSTPLEVLHELTQDVERRVSMRANHRLRCIPNVARRSLKSCTKREQVALQAILLPYVKSTAVHQIAVALWDEWRGSFNDLLRCAYHLGGAMCIGFKCPLLPIDCSSCRHTTP
jgi:hypothetical protein